MPNQPSTLILLLVSYLCVACFLPVCQCYLLFEIRISNIGLHFVQVLTVHSPFRVENLTNQQLEFNVHLFRGPQALGAPSKGAAAISMVPNRPLSPGQQTYLPVPAIWSVTTQLQSRV